MSEDDDGRERVQKILATAGVGSRRASEQLIAAGRVAVDGVTIGLGARADARGQVITVDGERIHTNPGLVYLLLNKPRGVVTTATDPHGRPTVMDLIPASPRVYPVGRLDQDTEGLLLLTNDGELANRLTHPRYEVEKAYVAQIRGPAKRHALRRLRDGVELEDGVARVRSVRELGGTDRETLLELVLAEGRKREVRRMLAAVELRLERLARIRVGPVTLRETQQGKFRPLSGQEVRQLYVAVGLGGPAPAKPQDRSGGTGRSPGRRRQPQRGRAA